MTTIIGRLPSGWTYMVAAEVEADWSAVFRMAQAAAGHLGALDYKVAAAAFNAIRRDRVLPPAYRAHALVQLVDALVPLSGDARGLLFAVRTAYDIARQSQRRPIFARREGVDVDLGHVEQTEDGQWVGWVSRRLGGGAFEDTDRALLVQRMIESATRAIGAQGAAS